MMFQQAPQPTQPAPIAQSIRNNPTAIPPVTRIGDTPNRGICPQTQHIDWLVKAIQALRQQGAVQNTQKTIIDQRLTQLNREYKAVLSPLDEEIQGFQIQSENKLAAIIQRDNTVIDVHFNSDENTFTIVYASLSGDTINFKTVKLENAPENLRSLLNEYGQLVIQMEKLLDTYSALLLREDIQRNDEQYKILKRQQAALQRLDDMNTAASVSMQFNLDTMSHLQHTCDSQQK